MAVFRYTLFTAAIALGCSPAAAAEPGRLDRHNLLQYRDAHGKVRPVTTPHDWQRRREEILDAMQRVMGKLPGPQKRVALEVKVEEQSDAGTYLRRLITYRSEPHSRTPAYLCIPKDVLAGKRKAPAVLCLHPTDNVVGHKVVLGLGGRPGRHYAAELAQRGYVTLSPSYPHLADYWPNLSRLGYVSGTMKAIWDNSRGLDLLASLEHVDDSRGFGAIGHSLGGHNAIYTAMFDARITVLASSCGFDSYLDYYDGAQQNWYFGRGWCQIRYMPRLSDYRGRLEELPFDFPELLGGLAPRPLYVNAPLHDDNFRCQSVDRCAAAARPVYELLGGKGNLIVEHPDCGHDFPLELRRAAYRMIDSVLRPKPDKPERKTAVRPCSYRPAAAGEFRAAAFESEITIPIGHACMGGGISDARQIVDPLFAKGFVLWGDQRPMVVVALDWCQCNNDSYDRWRRVLAEAAGTSPRRVMLATVHQHDAPICDLTAQKLLDQQGLTGYNCDPAFHEQAVQRTAAALKRSLASARRVTHFGIGRAKVERIASNRRVVDPQGRVSWARGSASGDLYGAPEGTIDPWLRTLSLWDGDRPLLAWSCYAVHPMSHYGRGGVSADFPGMARARRQKDDPAVFQIYFTGCAGDTTAGKYNTGRPENRAVLADRLYRAMLSAWQSTRRRPLGRIDFRVAELRLAARQGGDFEPEAMRRILADPKAGRWERIRAALGLSWRQRVEAGRPIDVPCLELGGGAAQFLIMPAETFVGYQLIAQRLRPEAFVVMAGFGDGAPGYIPVDQCFKDGYNDHYCWVPPMVQKQMTRAMAEALGTVE